jgi:hypothetical protein
MLRGGTAEARAALMSFDSDKKRLGESKANRGL